MRYAQRVGRRSLPGRPLRLASAAIVMATVLAACGGGGDGDDGDGGGGAEASGAKAPATIPELSDDPLTLSFVWFEWPPAAGARGPRQGVHQEPPERHGQGQHRPERAVARRDLHPVRGAQTNFDIPILDSQNIGEAVTNGNILDLTDFVKENIDVACTTRTSSRRTASTRRPRPASATRTPRLYGLPLLGDTWSMIYRKDLMGDAPPATWEDMIAAAKKCQDENPGMSGLAFHQANGSDAAAVTYNTVNASTAASCGTRPTARSRASSTTPPARRRWTSSSTRWCR